MSFFLVWRHKIISFFSKQLFLQFLIKNYCFNTFSSPVLGLKPEKVVFNARWCHVFAVTWREHVINFDWKYCFRRISKKHIEYFITIFWAQDNKISFWVSDDIRMTSPAPRSNKWLGAGSCLLSHI